jgi:hypothetical protein
MFERQQNFNAALVDHVNRNVPIARQTRESIASTLTVMHETIADLVRFQSLLVMFLQQITPYVDTRDRDVAGLFPGLFGAINTMSDELMKRTDAMLTRDRRQDTRIAEVEAQLAILRVRLEELTRVLQPRGSGGSP